MPESLVGPQKKVARCCRCGLWSWSARRSSRYRAS